MALTEYEKYIRTEELLSLQKSADALTCHDEMQFQIVHQVSELWMKLIAHELGFFTELLMVDERARAVTTLARIAKAQRLLIEQIDLLRRFGRKVHYGDASRLDLLRTAGAATARILVVAVDDKEQSLEIVDIAREHFPHLELVARARDVTHWNALRDRGVTRVERELFESSLRSARSVLELLGFDPHEARTHALRFREHNLELFEKMYPHNKDRAQLIAVVKQGRRQLEEQMAQERAEREERLRKAREREKGWGS